MADSRTSSYRVDFGSADVQLQRRSERLSGETDTTLGELDEETIRWGVLITRVICIALLLLIAFSATYSSAVTTEDSHLYKVLSVLFAIVLIVVFILSFFDLEALRSRTVWNGRFSLFSAGRSASFVSWPRTSNNPLDSPLNNGEQTNSSTAGRIVI